MSHKLINMKVFEAQQTFILLNKADFGKDMTTDEAHKVMSAYRVFKETAKAFDEFIEDSREKIKDEKELASVLQKEAEREVTLEYERLGSVFDKLRAANGWNIGQAAALEDVLR